MKKSIDQCVQEYFAFEVGTKEIPSLQIIQKNRNRLETFTLAALFAASLFCLFLPGSYENSLRKDVYVSVDHMDVLKENFARTVFKASREYYKSKGVSND